MDKIVLVIPKMSYITDVRIVGEIPKKKKKNQLTKVLSLNSIKIKLQEKRKTDK